MRRLGFIGAVVLMVASVHVNATEITACIINTKAKDNKVYYVFPTTSTKLICDHASRDSNLTLVDLYRDGWRLVNLFGPVPANQSKSKPIYNPPILYLERKAPATPALSLDPVLDQHLTGKAAVDIEKEDDKDTVVKEASTQEEEVAKEPEREERGGFFDWLAPKLDVDKPPEEEEKTTNSDNPLGW